MNNKTAKKQADVNIERLKNILKNEPYQEIFISAGQTYMSALQPIDKWLSKDLKFNTTLGPIGIQLHQLKDWLKKIDTNITQP